MAILYYYANEAGEALTQPATMPPWGVALLSDERRAEYFAAGLRTIDEADVAGLVFATPAISRDEQIKKLNSEYLPVFDQLALAIIKADALGDIELVERRQTDYRALQNEYNGKMEAIG